MLASHLGGNTKLFIKSFILLTIATTFCCADSFVINDKTESIARKQNIDVSIKSFNTLEEVVKISIKDINAQGESCKDMKQESLRTSK
jgi:hypothetical protein